MQGEQPLGLDPFLGFLPGVGDWLPLVVSLDLLFSAARLGAGGWVLTRMLGNIALDAAVGTVPLVGDLFDLGWKANRRNLALLDELVERPADTRRRSRLIVAAVLGGAVGVVAGGIWLGWLVLTWLLGLI